MTVTIHNPRLSSARRWLILVAGLTCFALMSGPGSARAQLVEPSNTDNTPINQTPTPTPSTPAPASTPSAAEKAQNNNDGCSSCCCPCTQPIINNQKRIRRHVDILGNDKEQSEFEEHRKWMALTFFQEHILRAMMMMTSQLTAVGVEQVRQIGNFLDAKHQLETQRLFQRLSVQAHKDYQPSEGICEIGTVSRSLLASERRTDLAKLALAQHALKRTLGSGEIVSVTGGVSDKISRLKSFVAKHCDINDNSKGLKNLCQKSAPKENRNGDIDYVRSIESKLTLDIDLTKAVESGAFMLPGDGGMPDDGTRFAAADVAPEAGDLAHYIHRARHDDELTRLSGSRWVPAIVADRAGRNPALILASGTPRSAGAPMPQDDRRGIPPDSNSVTGNAMDNDSYNVMNTRVTVIRAGNQRIDVPDTGWATIEGRFGDLMIRASGTFTYTLNGKPITDDEDVFHYTLTTLNGGSGDARIIIDFSLDPTGGTGGGNGGGGSGGGTGGGTGGGGGGGTGGGDDGTGGGGGDDGTGGGEDGEDGSGGTGSGSDGNAQGISDDYENVGAMMSNLISNDVLPKKAPEIYANELGEIRLDGAPLYMTMRSLTAKRSVAVNSLASIVGQRIAGEPESAPFLKRMIAELGVPESDVDLIVGKNPSYFAQMEVLTKKAYQNPVFYTELYDKRANLRRKDAALKAIGLMQDRDIYQSLLRSEMVGSILLETMLMEKQIRVRDQVAPKTGTGQSVIKGGN